ncbi:hypothetical protein OROHE_023540 [Orobanche hederae]
MFCPSCRLPSLDCNFAEVDTTTLVALKWGRIFTKQPTNFYIHDGFESDVMLENPVEEKVDLLILSHHNHHHHHHHLHQKECFPRNLLIVLKVFTVELAHQQPEFPLKKRADEPNNEIPNEILIEELRKNLKNNAFGFAEANGVRWNKVPQIRIWAWLLLTQLRHQFRKI